MVQQKLKEKQNEYQASREARTVLVCLGCHGPAPKHAGQAHRDSSWNFVVTVTE
jgi:hypothetical protein